MTANQRARDLQICLLDAELVALFNRPLYLMGPYDMPRRRKIFLCPRPCSVLHCRWRVSSPERSAWAWFPYEDGHRTTGSKDQAPIRWTGRLYTILLMLRSPVVVYSTGHSDASARPTRLTYLQPQKARCLSLVATSAPSYSPSTSRLTVGPAYCMDSDRRLHWHHARDSLPLSLISMSGNGSRAVALHDSGSDLPY